MYTAVIFFDFCLFVFCSLQQNGVYIKKLVVTALYSCENIGDKSKYLSMQLEVHS